MSARKGKRSTGTIAQEPSFWARRFRSLDDYDMRRRKHLLATKPYRSAARSVPIRRSLDQTYRHYRLIAGQRGDGFSAIAYAGKDRMFAGSGSDLEGALDDLKSQIDHKFSECVARRDGGQPTCDELSLALALASEKINDRMQHLLEALTTGSEVSVHQISRRSGSDRETLLRDIVRLARLISSILSISLPKGPANASAALDVVLNSPSVAEEAEEKWTFRPAFVEAAKKYLEK